MQVATNVTKKFGGITIHIASWRPYDEQAIKVEVTMLWTIILWVILGALAGWIASLITGMHGRIHGWMNVVVGIIGAFIGGLVLQLLGTQAPSGFDVASLLTAILGAIILLSLARAFRRDAF